MDKKLKFFKLRFELLNSAQLSYVHQAKNRQSDEIPNTLPNFSLISSLIGISYWYSRFGEFLCLNFVILFFIIFGSNKELYKVAKQQLNSHAIKREKKPQVDFNHCPSLYKVWNQRVVNIDIK